MSHASIWAGQIYLRQMPTPKQNNNDSFSLSSLYVNSILLNGRPPATTQEVPSTSTDGQPRNQEMDSRGTRRRQNVVPGLSPLLPDFTRYPSHLPPKSQPTPTIQLEAVFERNVAPAPSQPQFFFFFKSKRVGNEGFTTRLYLLGGHFCLATSASKERPVARIPPPSKFRAKGSRVIRVPCHCMVM